MSEDFLARLRAADPASDDAPDLAEVRARVFAHVSDNVVSYSPRRAWNRGLRYAAAAAVVLVAAGGGFWSGQNTSTNAEAISEKVTTGAPAAGAVAPGMGASATVGAADAKMAASPAMYWGGNTVLKPTSALPNEAGTARAYAFDASGVNGRDLALAIAKLLGLPANVKVGDNGEVSVGQDGNLGNVWVGIDSMVNFNGWSNANSPWNCGNDAMTGIKEGTAAGGSASAGGDQSMQEIQQQCDAEWPTPTDAAALQAAKAAFASLGLPEASHLTLNVLDQQQTRSRSVVGTLQVAGKRSTLTWTAEVAKLGVFSINGFAAKVVPADLYPVVGARDAALRTQQRIWSGFGPTLIGSPSAGMPGGVVTTTTAAPAQPTLPTKDGKPMPTTYVQEVTVSSATPGLTQVWLADGRALLMPAWDFTSDDGSVWQMIAIGADYVDWQQQASNIGIAYGGATVR